MSCCKTVLQLLPWTPLRYATGTYLQLKCIDHFHCSYPVFNMCTLCLKSTMYSFLTVQHFLSGSCTLQEEEEEEILHTHHDKFLLIQPLHQL